MGLVLALHHVNVTVPADAEAAAKNFYANILGLEQLPKPTGTRPSGAWYQIGPIQLHLSVEKEARVQSPPATCALRFLI
jgi:catechol 2,3-dioxygenase-like lactoylglutathione lyase family enzyme